jgi:very-short-patch-repair endonuclease
MVLSTDEFIERAVAVHGHKFDYSQVAYVNNSTKVNIICPAHGSFWIRPYHLTSHKQGCVSCNTPLSSKEKIISLFLSGNNIKFVPQQRFDDLISDHNIQLRYDFYLPEHNLIIEYDGEYHYTPIHGEEALKRTQKNDEIKTQYAEKHGIQLIRIPFYESHNLLDILQGIIKS